MSYMPECDPQDHKEKLQAPCLQISRKEMITWYEMWQSLQPHHCIVWQWGFYPIHKTCKMWDMTFSSSMTMYSVMHDIHDARRVQMEIGWVNLYLYATCEYSNQLTLEQWAFENWLPLFYTHCIGEMGRGVDFGAWAAVSFERCT